MSRSRALGLLSLSFVAASTWLACGARVVVDKAGSGTGGGGGAWSCVSPPLAGDVSSCAAPPPDPGFCIDWTLCDEGGHRFQTKCDEGGCHCLVDDVELCACLFEAPPCGGAGCCDALNDDGVQCCPYPWLGYPGCRAVGEPCTMNADCCLYSCTAGQCDP